MRMLPLWRSASCEISSCSQIHQVQSCYCCRSPTTSIYNCAIHLPASMSRTFHSGTSDNREAYVTWRRKTCKITASCSFIYFDVCAFSCAQAATSLFILPHRYTAARSAANHDEVIIIIDFAHQLRLRPITRIFQVALRSDEDFEQAHEQHELTSAAKRRQGLASGSRRHRTVARYHRVSERETIKHLKVNEIAFNWR